MRYRITKKGQNIKKLSVINLHNQKLGIRKISKITSISPTTVAAWIQIYKEQGPREVLEYKSNTYGRYKPGLSRTQMQNLRKMMNKGARSFGYPDDKWTKQRVWQLIKDEFNIEYSPDYPTRLMRSHNLPREDKKAPRKRVRTLIRIMKNGNPKEHGFSEKQWMLEHAQFLYKSMFKRDLSISRLRVLFKEEGYPLPKKRKPYGGVAD